ncbi:MAG: DUF2095 family protein [Thermoproteota archaeon]
MSGGLSEEELVKIAEEGYCEELEPRSLKGYVPNVFDYIRRCDTEGEAIQIVGFLESRGELPQRVAEILRRRIRERGVRFYGPKKDVGYYVEKYL